MESIVHVIYLGPPQEASVVKRQLGEGFCVEAVAPTRAGIQAALLSGNVILDASMKVPLDRALLESGRVLRLVITATTGADHIDRSCLEARGIPLLTLKGQDNLLNQLTPAAELSWLLLLACARKFRAAIHHVESGLWDREMFPGTMLNGRTLGLIGCGRLGKWMARYGTAFNMRVLGFDPYNHDWPADLRPVDLDTLFAESDFISIHVHLTEETRGLIGSSQLARVKPGAVLINTSRGAIVDEEALLDALKDGRLAAVGCDVLEAEPEIKNSRLWQYAQSHPNCILTPHVGGFSPDALRVVLEFTARRIADFFKPAERS